jgi:hypothetical protein
LGQAATKAGPNAADARWGGMQNVLPVSKLKMFNYGLMGFLVAFPGGIGVYNLLV